MPIKNKDGSPYSLRGPNPLMNTQDRWDVAKLVFHNLTWAGKTVSDETVVNTFATDFVIPPAPQPEPEPEKRDEPPEPVTVTKVVFHCQPAIVRERKDPIYGEVTKTIQYGSPFTFEGVVVENAFMSFKFWTTVEKISEGAIVFPMNNDRRWWRVVEKTAKTGGWLYDCITSDKQPSFAAAGQ